MTSVLAVVFCLTVAAGTVFVVHRSGTQGPPTAAAAADQLLRSLSQNSINEFEQALCASKRPQAGATLREFDSGLTRAGQELGDLTWRVTNENPRGPTEVDLDVEVGFGVAGGRTAADSWFPLRLSAVEDRGWYICNIEILAL